jgi:hypothetical protein
LEDIEEKIGQIKHLRLLKKMDRPYTACEHDIIRLHAEFKNAEGLRTKAQQRGTYEQLIRDVGEYWEEVVQPEEVPIMVETFVEKVVLMLLSPRFYRPFTGLMRIGGERSFFFYQISQPWPALDKRRK